MVDLSNAMLGDSDLKALAELNNLEEIRLIDSSLSKAQLSWLKSRLPKTFFRVRP